MHISFFQILLFLFIGIVLIFFLSIRYRLPAFYSLMIACFVVGWGFEIPSGDIIILMKDGFGNILKSLGFIIVLGTALGVVLAQTGSSRGMAEFILRLVGRKNAALGIGITGFIIGLPVFCDSGYIVLSGLNQSLSKRSGTPIMVTSVSLATALLSVHCMIPPHPGAAAAAATIGVDFGRMMIFGILIAIPSAIAGFFWAHYAGKKFPAVYQEEETPVLLFENNPSAVRSFLPVVIPIVLIAMKSLLTIERLKPGLFLNAIQFLGEPVIALIVGILLAFSNERSWKKPMVSALLTEAVEKAGGILVVIGAGGAFGAILAAGKIGDHAAHSLPISSMGLLFPFLLTSILKTAQGSSTVAIITASSIILPLLPVLHLDNDTGRLLAVLSMGAGSMMISQANDAYFWVIAKFSGLDVKGMLRVYSPASFFMGITGLAAVYILSIFLR